jgi:hypothetical protein
MWTTATVDVAGGGRTDSTGTIYSEAHVPSGVLAMAKRIVVCSDGTGNTAIKGRGTNVFKVFEAEEARFLASADDGERCPEKVQIAKASRRERFRADTMAFSHRISTGACEKVTLSSRGN